MIAWLRGILRDKRPPHLVLDVNGVGYELEAPMTTFYALPELGESLTLYTHQVVREDAHSLYAFAAEDERNLFRSLIRVNGVGAKLGLAILSGMDAAAFSRCIWEADTGRLQKLPGVGKKTAERLVVEMRDRLGRGTGPGTGPIPEGAAAVGAPASTFAPTPTDEAVDALVALGLKPDDASRRVRAIQADGLACEEIVRRALQAMAK